MHLWCRFVQGFAGAFIFFYAFLLSVALFQAESSQQDFAMTSASTALNIAEVLGSLFGALLYEFWGQSSVFWFLGVASLVNQVVLIGVMCCLEAQGAEVQSIPSSISFQMMNRRSGWKRVCTMLSSKRLAVAVILIFSSAVVKGGGGDAAVPR